MKSFFCKITEGNKLTLNKPVDNDMVYYSELNEWFTNNAFRSFSVKYVLDNCIHYRVGNKTYDVPSGNFLLASRQPGAKAYFESPKKVKSICIDIRPETVQEAFTVMSAKEDHNLDNYRCDYFQHPHFFESVSPVQSGAAFAGKLDALAENIYRDDAAENIDGEWFLDLVEKIIYHEFGNYLSLNGIHSVKYTTKKELLLRLKKGRAYMDECFLHIEDIAEVATVSHLSEFHFFRLFRQAFKTTPYQYLLGKRLDLARNLVKNGNSSMNKIAAECRFPDLPTFSKAFKRRFGFSPAQYPHNV